MWKCVKLPQTLSYKDHYSAADVENLLTGKGKVCIRKISTGIETGCPPSYAEAPA